MTAPSPVPLPGCRHDVLGQALKAIGILRAISQCAAPEDRDPSAEGWWNLNNGAFMIQSARYPDCESLVKFFAEKYRPTPIIAAWNKSGGVTDKITVEISGDREGLEKFISENSAALKELGLTPAAAKKQPLSWSPDSSAMPTIVELVSATSFSLRVRVSIEANPVVLKQFKEANADRLDAIGLAKSKKVPKSGKLTFDIRWQDMDELQSLLTAAGLPRASTRKEGAKKDGTLPDAARALADDQTFLECLDRARSSFANLQGAAEGEDTGETPLLKYRDRLPEGVAESFDALCSLHISQQNDNPLFVRRGRPGNKVNADIFLNFWNYFVRFRRDPSAFAAASLFADRVVGTGISKEQRKGTGTTYFPDAIKSYNQGIQWVTDEFPFCPLDYVLAVEGAFVMRGATSRTLSARSRTRAAFPFVFEGTDLLTDQDGKTSPSVSFWYPLWGQPTTYQELQSFLLDGQARLPSKDCRFSAEFARAIRSQGVDAGFCAFQEFRFKLKADNYPWTTSGRFMACSRSATANVLNELLGPVDACGFLNQFEFSRERKSDLHPLRAPVLDAIEAAASEPDASKILDVLCGLASLNGQLARSKSLREKVGTGRIAFVPPLRCDDWSVALRDLERDPEFEVARALASLRGHEQQPDGKFSDVEPALGSLLPLRRTQSAWYLPDPPSPQAVWSGIDLTRDLAAVLARRVVDSAKDAWPAVVGNCPAKLPTILQFLRGELDDRRIALLVEGLSLIDWQYQPRRPDTDDTAASRDESLDPVPLAYAAVRSLLEVARQPQPREGLAPKERSGPCVDVQRAVALVSRREPGMVTTATIDALRRLAVVGVPNTYGEDSRREKPRLAGRDVIAIGTTFASAAQLSRRLAAAVLIPLDPRDTWKLFQAITLPQTLR